MHTLTHTYTHILLHTHIHSNTLRITSTVRLYFPIRRETPSPRRHILIHGVSTVLLDLPVSLPDVFLVGVVLTTVLSVPHRRETKNIVQYEDHRTSMYVTPFRESGQTPHTPLDLKLPW